jgi:predicted DNA-binding WGR domain protein
LKNTGSTRSLFQDNTSIDLITLIEPLFLQWVNHQKQRYYQVYLGKDMLQDYVLTKSWGSITEGRGRVIHIAYSSYAEAVTEFKKVIRVRKRRGYVLVSDKSSKIAI